MTSIEDQILSEEGYHDQRIVIRDYSYVPQYDDGIWKCFKSQDKTVFFQTLKEAIDWLMEQPLEL